MINLNDPKYTNRVTKEDLLKVYSEYDIMRYYIGNFNLGETYNSPLRRGDENPSFNVFYSRRNNCLLFKDFAGKRGDFVVLVQELLFLPSYQHALDRIAEDMLTGKEPIIEPTKTTHVVLKREEYDIRIAVRKWEERDFKYWDKYGITFHTLNLYNVVPIQGYWINSSYISTMPITYAYLEYKDRKLTYKIYRPTAEKHNKWRSNTPYSVHQGYKQLPKTGKLLIITKALKDVMCIHEHLLIPSIGVQSETCFIKDSVVDEYKERFSKVLTLFDNDRQGKEQAASYKKLYDIDPIFIPDEFGVKDFSDLRASIGLSATNVLKRLI